MKLQRITGQARDMIREMADRGEITIPQLREMHQAHQRQDRVYQRPNETVYETTDTTIQIFYFED